MDLEMGERITYEDEVGGGESLTGVIVAISKNRVDKMPTYLVVLDSGQYIQIKPDDLDKCKAI
jgi:hypothetical protein